MVKLVFIGMFILYVWALSRGAARKLSKKKQLDLQNKYLVHFTSDSAVMGDGSVYLKAKEGFQRNSSTFNRPAVYFFVDEPSAYRIGENKITSHEKKVIVPFSNLDPDKVRYRPRDRVIAYLGDYQGNAVAHAPNYTRTFWALVGINRVIYNCVKTPLQAFLMLLMPFLFLAGGLGMPVEVALQLTLWIVGIPFVTFLYFFRKDYVREKKHRV